jgi:hypothetical protein
MIQILTNILSTDMKNFELVRHRSAANAWNEDSNLVQWDLFKTVLETAHEDNVGDKTGRSSCFGGFGSR